jgi:hypothetical protein
MMREVSQYSSRPIASTGILRYVRPKVERSIGRGIIEGTGMYADG